MDFKKLDKVTWVTRAYPQGRSGIIATLFLYKDEPVAFVRASDNKHHYYVKVGNLRHAGEEEQ